MFRRYPQLRSTPNHVQRLPSSGGTPAIPPSPPGSIKRHRGSRLSGWPNHVTSLIANGTVGAGPPPAPAGTIPHRRYPQLRSTPNRVTSLPKGVATAPVAGPSTGFRSIFRMALGGMNEPTITITPPAPGTITVVRPGSEGPNTTHIIVIRTGTP